MTDRFLIDSHKLLYHPDRVAAVASAQSDPEKYRALRPIYAEISTSGACNHRCTFCSVDYIGYKSVFLSLERLTAFFQSAHNIGLKSVMFAGDGEPFLHPQIEKVVAQAFNYSISTSFTTNAVHLKNSYVESSLASISWIKASVNAGTPHEYSKIHRTNESDFSKVWSNLSFASNYRQKHKLSCALGVQSLLLPENLKTLDALAQRSIDTGLDYLVLKPYVHNVYMNQEGYGSIDYCLPKYEETVEQLQSKYNCESFNIVSRVNALNKLNGATPRYNTCYSTPSLWFYVSGNGDVYTCGAHVGNPHFLIGNINQDSIESIWSSDSRLACHEFVVNELDLSTCRRTCRMDEANTYLSNIIDRNIQHVDFI